MIEADRARPDGCAPGVAGLALAWLGGVAIARLTGATAVVICLAVLASAAVVAGLGGWLTVRRAEVTGVALPSESTAGTPVAMVVDVASTRDQAVWLDVRVVGGDAGRTVASGWADAPLTAAFPERGVVTQLDVVVRATGAFGLVWWRRRVNVDIAAHLVAPPAVAGPVSLERRPVRADGTQPGRNGALVGDPDGVREWRDGDSHLAVHWASSLRAGQLVVHDRRQPADRVTVVRAVPGPDPDASAAAALAALQAALATADVVMAAAGAGEPVPIRDRGSAVRWAATAPLGHPQRHHAARIAWWRIDVIAWLRRPVEPDRRAGVTARWWAAASTLIALTVLAGALGYGPVAYGLMSVGVVAGAAVSARAVGTGGEPSAWVRAVAGIGALVAIAAVAARAGRLDGLLAVLRGPLPQLLIVLIVLHGFECRDRRSIRVGVAISAIVVMYAAGFRVDRLLGVWLAAWAITAGAALALLANRRAVAPTRRWRRAGAATLVGAGLTLAGLVVVPVPSGPARLTLPTLIEDHLPVGAPGALAAPDGTLTRPGAAEGSRGRVGPSDYAGFAESLDTNVRGELGDQVVMRVRADQPDFWRGQTFAEFDGRTWHADTSRGAPLNGPHVDLPPSFGDATPGVGRYSLEPETFVQTYFVEHDQTNLLYHAYQPSQAVVDADVWARPDGALRSSTVLPAGSVYTMVSERRPVTAEWLRRSGDVAGRLTDVGKQAFARYLEVPATTSTATRQLADGLAADDATTYDMLRSYEAWIDAHVTYDLAAPLPADGEDAVDALLFGSRRGFCEQIASALVVMLRTQGVPARLATGYTPGTRDPVSGVWVVRAENAHAWAEVWFPEVGWQAFDPTAGVPLAGDTDPGTVGVGVVRGARGWAAGHPASIVVAAAIAVSVAGLARLVVMSAHRRRRGRWGLLQDRFTDAAARVGAPSGATNRRRADAWTAADDRAMARAIAGQLDAAAFDPAWADDDERFADTRKLVGSLARGRR